MIQKIVISSTVLAYIVLNVLCILNTLNSTSNNPILWQPGDSKLRSKVNSFVQDPTADELQFGQALCSSRRVPRKERPAYSGLWAMN